jgi:hypothetical protein
MFFVPGVFSVVLLAFLWKSGSVRHPVVVACWCALGIILQARGAFASPDWLAGLLMSVTAAIYLSIRLKLG